MEEKIVEDKKEDLPSLDLFHSLTSITSLSSVYLLSLPTIYHPTLVHRHFFQKNTRQVVGGSGEWCWTRIVDCGGGPEDKLDM